MVNKKSAPLDDEQLVHAVWLGSTETYGTLCQKYRGGILGVIISIVGNRDMAEDILQDTLLIAYRSLHQLRTPSRFGHWLCIIARRQAYRYLEIRKRVDIVPLQEDEPSEISCRSSGQDPAEEFDRNEQVAQVHKEISRLPMQYQVLLELRYWRQLNTSHIAQILGLPESTVKWRIHEAKRLLLLSLGDTIPKEERYEQR
jgi:RNA polymerase sigma-70 factor (ECF subfamily)